MSIRQQRRAIAEARARKAQGSSAAGGAIEGGDDAADAGRVATATLLRTPAAQLGLQVRSPLNFSSLPLVWSCVCVDGVPQRL
jgi:hypothetical protein